LRIKRNIGSVSYEACGQYIDIPDSAEKSKRKFAQHA
jgi:hypothetical protein